jgi:hypothetical protein
MRRVPRVPAAAQALVEHRHFQLLAASEAAKLRAPPDEDADAAALPHLR